jgi:hypothetical protein
VYAEPNTQLERQRARYARYLAIFDDADADADADGTTGAPAPGEVTR